MQNVVDNIGVSRRINVLVHVTNFQASMLLMQHTYGNQQAVLVEEVGVNVARCTIEEQFILQGQVGARPRWSLHRKVNDRAVKVAKPKAIAPSITCITSANPALLKPQAVGHANTCSHASCVHVLLPQAVFSEVGSGARAVCPNESIAQSEVSCWREQVLQPYAQQRLICAMHLVVHPKLQVRMDPPMWAKAILAKIGEPIDKIMVVLLGKHLTAKSNDQHQR